MNIRSLIRLTLAGLAFCAFAGTVQARDKPFVDRKVGDWSRSELADEFLKCYKEKCRFNLPPEVFRDFIARLGYNTVSGKDLAEAIRTADIVSCEQEYPNGVPMETTAVRVDDETGAFLGIVVKPRPCEEGEQLLILQKPNVGKRVLVSTRCVNPDAKTMEVPVPPAPKARPKAPKACIEGPPIVTQYGNGGNALFGAVGNGQFTSGMTFSTEGDSLVHHECR